jgi:UDP-N-acetylmuramoyl-L-alanyl-D-glutamate--2,6-diaminopimelate ligase
MQFTDLIYGAEVLAISGDVEISGLHYDSRKVETGYCFVAMRGETTDGNRHIDSALRAGAKAVVSDSPEQQAREGIAWATVPHGRRALARLSANFYQRPAEKLNTVGVTGTNGKTTTTFIVSSILGAAQRKSALIGTIEYRIAGELAPAPHTTPESLELNQFFALAVSQGVKDVVMEVSSHALAQERVFGVPFDVAVFTNLTRDHLDYHQTMESYFDAKQALFTGCGTGAPRIGVINRDDEYGRKLMVIAKAAGVHILTYSMDAGDYCARNVDVTARGTRFDLETPEGGVPIFSPLVGNVNVYNLLAGAAAAQSRGCSLEEIRKGIAALEHVPGRFQRVEAGQPFSVVVDYAHTDDALRNLTALARDLVKRAGNKGRVITIFGCGGDRDRRKRPLMGAAAGKGSDFVVLTSDNPRTEDPLAIMHDALPGLRESGTEFTIEPDRERAIAIGVRIARAGDIVLIAGKGHEKIQITADGTVPFDDVTIARRALHRFGFAEEFVSAEPKGVAR